MRVDSSLQGTNAKTFEGSCRRSSLPGGGFPTHPPITAVGATAGKSYPTTTGLVTVPCMLISRHSHYWQSPVGPVQEDRWDEAAGLSLDVVAYDPARAPRGQRRRTGEASHGPLHTSQHKRPPPAIASVRGPRHRDVTPHESALLYGPSHCRMSRPPPR